MDYVRLGLSGLKVSRLCLGCMSFGSSFEWMLPEAPSFALVRKALDAGINFFDTANAYSAGESEQILGRALKSFGARRDDVVIATKVFLRDGTWSQSAGPVPQSIFFRPSTTAWSDSGLTILICTRSTDSISETPIDETLEALGPIGQGRKGALSGRLEHAGLPVRQTPVPGRPAKCASLCQHAEQLQPAVQGRGARGDPIVPGGGRSD